jgi:predicted dehydrogenase
MDSENQLNIGVLGLDRRGQALVQVMADMPPFHIQAVADRDTQLVEKRAQQLTCEAFDDYRQFVLQSDFNTLFVAANLHSCLEHVRMAIKDRSHILKLAPMSRTFEEAAQLHALCRDQGTRFDVVNPGRHTPAFQAFQRLVQAGQMDRPFLLRLFCDVGLLAGLNPELFQIHPDNQTSWITDQALAGGGVLLHNCYQLIDQLVLAFGLPQQVYSLCNSHSSGSQKLHHLTEDTALVTMRFGDNLIADLVAMRHWDDRPTCQQITLFGRDAKVTVCQNNLRIHNKLGELVKEEDYRSEIPEVDKALLTNYHLSLADPETVSFGSDAEANLKVMAVMEAAYLSARTGSPEDPARILSIEGL